MHPGPFYFSPVRYALNLSAKSNSYLIVMASSNDSEASSGDFPSYARYIHALAKINPKFEWLSRFFAYTPPVSTLTGEVSIMTSENGTLTDEVFSEDLLLSGPKPGTTRLVIISYEEIWTIDRDVLDRVAMALNPGTSLLSYATS